MRCAVALTLSLVIGTACTPVGYYPRVLPPLVPRVHTVYGIALTQVERPASTATRYGPQVITPRNDSSVTRYGYEDQLVAMTIVPTTSRVLFSLTNKTDHSIKIVWSDAAFVTPDGQSGPVMHTGMRYSQCGDLKAPTVVAARASVSDEIIPCADVRMNSSTWVIDDYFEDVFMNTSDTVTTLSALRPTVIGKRIQTLLPLQIEDTVNEYTFTFEVKDLTARPWTPD